jgi:drug/metabolite transporter (DMT)-like permease
MMSATPRPWISDASLLSAVIIWGLNFPILKAALSVMHPHLVNVFRFTISVIVLGTIYAIMQRSSGHAFLAPVRRHPWKIAGLGLLGFVFYQFFFIVGVSKTAAGTAALIMAGAPMFTAIAGSTLRTEYLRPIAWIGLIVSLLGTAVVVLGAGTSLAPGTLSGNLLMVCAALFWGLYTALSRPVLSEVSPIGLSFFGLVAGLPILYAIGLPYFGSIDLTTVELKIWLAILFSGAFSTGIGVVIWNLGVKNVGASHTAAYNNLVPFVALLFSFLILAEPVTWLQVAGGIMIVGGLVLMRRVRPVTVRPL